MCLIFYSLHDFFVSPVRTCWGPEPRHTEALAFFLDNGVPLDDIYDMCMEMTKNAGTKALLQERKGRGEL